jgi:hypothetical protein
MNKLSDLNYGQIRKQYMEACAHNDVVKVKNLLAIIANKHPEDLLPRLNNGLLSACVNGNLELVKYFLTTKDLPINANINVGAGVKEPIRQACENGHIELIEYLLASPELSEHAYIDEKGFPFIAACRKNQLPVMDFFLNNELTKNQINMEMIKTGIELACRNEQVEPIKYLIEKTNIRQEKDFYSFINLTFELALQYKNIDTIRYFIFDLGIEKNKEIEEILKNQPNEDADKWFELVKINNDLYNELNANKQNNKGLKL